MGGEDDGAFAHLGSKQNTANKLRRRGGGSQGGEAHGGIIGI